MTTRILTYIALAALIIALVGNITVFAATRNITHANCAAINALKSNARAQIQRSEKTLPTLQYYKDNPKELVLAIKQSEEAKAQFKETQCNDAFPF